MKKNVQFKTSYKYLLLLLLLYISLKVLLHSH